MIVGIMAIMAKVRPAKYLANIMFRSEIGLVNNSSIVPVRRSSAMDRTVMAGIKIRRITCDRLKKGIMSDTAPSNKLVLYDKIQ